MKRFISLLLAVLTLVACIPMAVSSEEPIIPETGMPFTDVKTSHWFYDAVKYTYDNGIFAANNSAGDLFGPNVTMTRGMFVTVLFRLSGVDQSDYTGETVFTDVPVNQWYAKAVEWASGKGYVAGMSPTTFVPNGKITRSQMARILALYAAGEDSYDLTDVRPTAFEKFADASKVQDWAKEGITWVSSTGLINGMGTENGGPVLNPNGNATRAQAAQILMSYMELRYNAETPIGEVYIGENNLADYTIVYGRTATEKSSMSAKEAAEQLRDYIFKATGLTLPVKNDTEAREDESNDKEILIGRTNREDNGLVSIDRTDFDSNTLLIEVQGNYLILASREDYAGTYYAVYEFCEQYLGYTFYGIIDTVEPKNVVKVPADLYYTETTFTHYRMNLTDQYGQNDQLRASDDMEYTFGNLVHTLPRFALSPEEYAKSDHMDYYMASDPCLSDPVIQQNIIDNVISTFMERTYNNMLWVCQSDGVAYCRCEDCAAFYRQYGRCATYINILDVVADAMDEAAATDPAKARLKDCYVMGIAYKQTYSKLKNYEDWDMNDNIILCIATDNACSSHAITDPNCTNKSNSNVDFKECFEIYADIVDRLFIWDYPRGEYYTDAPYPNLHQLYYNYKFFDEMGVEGIYSQTGSSESAAFKELRTYVVAMLSWENDLSETEYWAKIDHYLEAYYGDGWSYIREYMDAIHELASENEWHQGLKDKWTDIVTYEQYLENFDYLMGLWEKAESLAHTDEQKLRVRRSAVQMKYIEVCMAYEAYRISGDAADLESFKTVNKAYVAYLATLENCRFKQASNWTVDGDPMKWNNDAGDCWNGEDEFGGALCPCRDSDGNCTCNGCEC